MSATVDAVVVGAGPAGCAAAILLARRGWRVELLDRRRPGGFKLCTHAIMPAGVAVLEQMGVRAAIEAAGATRWWGVRLWLNGVPVQAPLPRSRVTAPYGLSLRRERLDPLLLAAAMREPDVHVRTGWAFTRLIGEASSIRGVRVRDALGAAHTIEARLVIGADGRHSQVAAAARMPAKILPNQHSAWIAYLAGIPEEVRPALEGYYWHGRSASLLPADDGLRVSGVMTPAGAWPPAEAGQRMLESLRRFPPLHERLCTARIVGQPVHISSLRNIVRVPARDGVVLIGDAALQTDPAFGQGISWALQSAAAAVPEIDRFLRGGPDAPLRSSLAAAFRRPQSLGVFAGTGLLSALRPGSWPERLLAANAAAGVWSTELAMRLSLSLVTTSTSQGLLPTLTARLRETLAG